MKKVINFEEYLFDKIFEAAVAKETAILISDRLENLLDDIDHPISQELIRFNHTDDEKSDKVTLLDYDETDKGKFTYTIPAKLIEYIEKEEPDYLDDLESNYYLKRVTMNVPEIWTKHRTSTTIGKVVNKLFPSKYKPNGVPGEDIESFANLVKLERTKLENAFERFRIVDGKDIVKYYNSNTYDDRADYGSNLGSSCMRYSRCENYIEFYAKNPGVKLVILMSDEEDQKDRITGRALLWDIEYIDSEPVDRKFMDRIYVIFDSDTALFKEYAKKNGWLYKSRQTMCDDEKIHDTLDDSDNSMELETPRCFRETGEYPYMDTMKYYNYDRRFLTNRNDDNGDTIYFLEDTGGGYEGRGGGIYVDFYGDYIDEDDLIYCELGDDWRYPDDAIYIECEGEYATEEYAENNYTCDIYGDYINSDDAVWSDYHEGYINSEDSIDVHKRGASDVDTIDELSDNTDSRESDQVGNSVIEYSKKGYGYLYFDDQDKDNFEEVESLLNGYNVLVHKVWDADKIFTHNGKKYLDDAGLERRDQLIGQKRLDF